MKAMKSMKLFLTSIIICLMSLVAFTPNTVAYANGLNEVTVEMGTDGLTVSGGGLDNGSTSSSWNNLIGKSKNFVIGISGIATVAMILFFIILLTKLGATADNPSERAKVVKGLIVSGLAVAGLGSVTTFVGIFYGMFQGK